MNKKNINLRTTIWMGLFVFLTIIPSTIFAIQAYDLDEFDDLELKSSGNQKKKNDNDDDKQKLILFDDNLYLLDNDFDFGDEELELLKLGLNPNDIEISKEYEKFLNAFFENSKLIRRPSSSEKSNPPIIKQEKLTPQRENKIEDFTPVDSNSFEEVNPPTIKKEETNSSKKNQIEDLTPKDSNSSEKSNPPINKHSKAEIKELKRQSNKNNLEQNRKNQLSILSRIGFGLNYVTSYNNLGPIIGGTISVNSMEWGAVGVDLMYILIKQDGDASLNETKKHTTGITGFYERKILNKIVLKGGLSYVKTGDAKSLGLAAGAGLSFHIGKMLIIQPMADINFASTTNNTMGINLNIGISL